MNRIGIIVALLSLVSCASTRENFDRAQKRQTASLDHLAVSGPKILGP